MQEKSKVNYSNESKKKIIIMATSILLVLALVAGISYALEIFKESSTDNTIKSGKVAMSYTESSNVINITNALPMTDNDGKLQTNYFDFSITSNADTNTNDNEGIKIPYNLIIEPKTVDTDKTALANNQIKVYLTKIENGSETKIMEPTKISELTAKDTNFNLYKTENTHKTGNGAMTTKYRLRAWIDYNVESKDFNTKIYQYKFAVNVNATGEIGKAEFQTVVPQDNSGANTPVLTSNMIPVYYDENDDKWHKADITKKNETNPWYDYDQKKWANAVTVNETNRSTYLSADATTPIEMEDINAMFVWIPRYKYTYFASNTPTEIPITFESGTETTGTITCTETIDYDETITNNVSETCTDTTNGSITKGTSTYTHPAFTFGNQELTGIWVGKFENSATELPGDASTELRTVIIKPDVQSWNVTAISYFANSIRNMELANNIYGFPQIGTTLNIYTEEITGDSNSLDTHMMKNMEWGAVAYFTHSKYGKNSDVFINNSSINGTSYTGRSGGNVGGSTPINGTYTDQTSTVRYNTYGFYTYDGYLLKYDTNEKSTTRDLSKVASTTGNIYGIYDMSGGSFEHLMANSQDVDNNFNPSSSETWNATNKPLDKYYDKYTYGFSSREYSRGKLGDATIEMQPTELTGNWYNTYALFASGSKGSWFARGGGAQESKASIFYSHNMNGGGAFSFGTRSVLSITTN